jgi:hypothetical protein
MTSEEITELLNSNYGIVIKAQDLNLITELDEWITLACGCGITITGHTDDLVVGLEEPCYEHDIAEDLKLEILQLLDEMWSIDSNFRFDSKYKNLIELSRWKV